MNLNIRFDRDTCPPQNTLKLDLMEFPNFEIIVYGGSAKEDKGLRNELMVGIGSGFCSIYNILFYAVVANKNMKAVTWGWDKVKKAL